MLYSNIINEFDRTRGYVWPCLKKFIDVIPNKYNLSIYEAGCGNGRNLIYAKNSGFSSVCGTDICPEFVKICKDKNLDVSTADILDPLDKKYDIILSVAVIHHLDSEEKRIKSIYNLLNGLKEYGILFLTFWSYEVGDSIVKKKLELGDNIVPWRSKKTKQILENRYYYIYNKENLINTLNKLQVDFSIEWEEQNWIVIIKK
jgi:tRNA (uracil-5-)-methyltransferase TRM9